MKVSVLSVLAFDKFWANVNVIGPTGEIQLIPSPVEDLNSLLSSIAAS